MPQFSMNESRRPILEQLPDYSIEITRSQHHITVRSDNIVLAESDEALLLQETRHEDIFYLPRRDVNLSLLRPTDLSTYCPFKGHACYWRLNETQINFVWSYEDPYPEVEAIRSYLSFYTDKVLVETK